MTAAAELFGDRVDVDVAFRSQADAPVVGPDLLEENDSLDALDGEREIDQPVGVVVGGAAIGKEALVDTSRLRRWPAASSCMRAEHRSEEFQAAQAVAVEDAPSDRLRIHARLDALATDVERARRNIRIMKRSGVGQNRDIDVDGDFVGQRDAQLAHEVEHHFAARCGRNVEPVDRAIHRVADMVVDVDDEAGDRAPPRPVRDKSPDSITMTASTGIVDALSDLDLGDAGKRQERSGAADRD